MFVLVFVCYVLQGPLTATTLSTTPCLMAM